MSVMVKSFAEELQLEIKPLKTIFDIEATGVVQCLIMGMSNAV